MYSAIAANKRNTVFIILIFLAVIGGLASLVAWYWDNWAIAIGTLVIAVLDGPSEKLVWRAQAEGTVTNDAERTAETIREAIEKAFEEFPLAKRGE